MLRAAAFSRVPHHARSPTTYGHFVPTRSRSMAASFRPFNANRLLKTPLKAYVPLSLAMERVPSLQIERLNHTGRLRFYSSGPAQPPPEDDSANKAEPREENTETEEQERAHLLPAFLNAREVVQVAAEAPFPDIVPVLSLPKKPVMPGVTGYVGAGPDLLKLINSNFEKSNPYVGIFLLKEAPMDADSASTGSIAKLDEIYDVGIMARVVNTRQEKDNVLVKGISRVAITQAINPTSGAFEVAITRLRDEYYDPNDPEIVKYSTTIWETMKTIAELNPSVRDYLQQLLDSADMSPTSVADLAVFWCGAPVKDFQDILETLDVKARLYKVTVLLNGELLKLRNQTKLLKGIEDKAIRNQQKYFLMENLKSISKELGMDSKNDKEQLVEKFKGRLKDLRVPKDTMQIINDELAKLGIQEPHSSEYNVTRQYLEILTTLPWGVFVKENFELNHAEKVLDEDHYGLKDVKDRILEFIAVGKRKGFMKGKILCFVGPPGVGKTSIGKSVARALGRYFYRFAVGGLYDISEIKGHRRTYVGSFPGKIINALRLAKSSNPVIMIDEIDKLRIGNHGDPSAALLEVLDPEQNTNFVDHYLDVPFDLSKVLFLCTANVTDTIPQPLLDRMEVVRLSGYIFEEKIAIAKKYLLPVLMEQAGLKETELEFAEEGLNYLVKWYSREAGVRRLGQFIDKICRKVARKVEQGGEKHVRITESNIEEFVGKPQFTPDSLYKRTPIGVVVGLATGPMGGGLTYVETVLDKIGRGDHLRVTGSLGDVLKESTNIAYTIAKIFFETVSPGNRFFESAHFHIHLPEGATPKDGPSAGISIVTSLLSVALNRPVRQRLAMTGEITLTGRVLPIGGVKDKTIAAKRAGVKDIILPIDNKKDFEELDPIVKKGITVHYAEWYKDVYEIAFETTKTSKSTAAAPGRQKKKPSDAAKPKAKPRAKPALKVPPPAVLPPNELPPASLPTDGGAELPVPPITVPPPVRPPTPSISVQRH